MIPTLLALLPVIVILLLLVVKKTPADIAGVIGWITTAVIAWWYFESPLQIVLSASLAGLIASLPIAAIDRIGEESRVLPVTFVISIAITILCGLLALFWAF